MLFGSSKANFRNPYFSPNSTTGPHIIVIGKWPQAIVQSTISKPRINLHNNVFAHSTVTNEDDCPGLYMCHHQRAGPN